MTAAELQKIKEQARLETVKEIRGYLAMVDSVEKLDLILIGMAVESTVGAKK